MSMTFQSNKMPFLALELPRFLTFDMDQLGKHRGHHWKKRLKISKTGNLIWKWYVFSKWRYSSASCEILQMFVWWRGEGLCLSPPPPPTPPYQCLENVAALRSHIFVTSHIFVVPKQWRIQGRGPRAPIPPYFKPKLSPEGPKKICLETAPPPTPLSKGLDDRALPPPPLSQGLDPALPKSTYKFSTLISIHFFEKLVETIW